MKAVNEKENSICKAVANTIREYCSISTIHGFSYITTSRYLIEKLLWAAIVIGSLYCGLFLSFVALNRYYTNPIVISMERDRFSWTTSLPAVTICPLKNLNNTALEKYLEERKSTDKTNLREFLISLFYSNYSNFETFLNNDEIHPDEYMSIILKLQRTIKPDISFSGQSLEPAKWLYQTITEVGVCYGFNSQLAVYNTYQYWKAKKWEILPQHKTFEVHPLDGEDFATINISISFNVYVHGPYEVPDVTNRPIYVSHTNFLQAYFTALSIITSEATRNLGIGQRQCRYYNESNLKHSPVYTYVLCRRECRILLTKKLCGCVPHFYRKLSDENTCDVKGLRCIFKHKEQLLYLEDSAEDCICAANCEEVNYVVQELDFREWFLGSNLQYGIKNFPEMRLKRDVIFAFSDLLVYIGGVIGLFVGASVLSIIELIYYFTLRLFWFVIKNQY